MAMYARVAHFEGSPHEVEEGLQRIRKVAVPAARKQRGFKGGYWLVDRASGKGLAITLWSSEKEMQASEAAERSRSDSAAEEGAQIGEVARYEVAEIVPLSSWSF